jgi:hypothetical protein
MIDRRDLFAPSVSLEGPTVPYAVVTPGDSGVATFRARVLSADTVLRSCDGRVCLIPTEVLQAGVQLFDGMPFKVDHDRSVLATVGKLLAPSWSEASDICPAGVDADLEIHQEVSDDAATTSALLTRRLVSSVSSTFGGEWAQSHPELSEEEFWSLYGQEHEGRIVCEYLTRLAYVREVSLVDRGGDPHSRRLRAPDEEYVMAAMTPASLVAAILPLMGLPPETTMEELMSAIGKVLMGKDPEKKEPEAPEAPEAPAVPAEAPMAAPQDLLALQIALTPDGQTMLSAPAALVEALRLRTVQPAQVDVALACGQITPAEAKVLRPMELSAPESLRGLLATRPKNSAMPLSGSQVNGQPAPLTLASPTEPTALEIERGKKHGITVEQLKAAKAEQRRHQGYED